MSTDPRADGVAAWATGIGIGLIAFMVTWIVAARLAEALLPAPARAFLAMGAALVVGLATGARQGWRLSRRVLSDREGGA